MSTRLVVIGGVAAGMSAASKAKREAKDLEVVAFERNGFTSYGACGLPYVLEGLIARPEDLVVRTPAQFARQGIEARVRHEVTRVDYEGRRVEVLSRDEGRTTWERFDKLLVATGASPFRPRIPGVEQEGVFVLRTVEDGAAVLEALGRAERTVVVGAGYVGLEVAEAFRERGKAVTVVEAMDRALPAGDPEASALVAEELARRGVELLTSTRVTAFAGAGRLEAVETDHGTIPADLVLLSVGIRPNVALAESFGVELGPTGAIRVGPGLETSLPDVWAAGDVAESPHLVTGAPTWLPLGDVANKHGRVAGATIAGKEARFAGVVGTAITKVFDLGVAMTGLTEPAARAAGLDVAAVSVKAPSRAHYYPGHDPVHVKLVYSKADGRLVGGHVLGPGESAKRIDVIATLLARSGTVEDLAALDLAYAPPFSPVWDPLLTAANQAAR